MGREKVAVAGTSATETGTDNNDGSSRYVGSGRDVLDNNGINFLMAAMTTVVGMVTAWAGAQILA